MTRIVSNCSVCGFMILETDEECLRCANNAKRDAKRRRVKRSGDKSDGARGRDARVGRDTRTGQLRIATTLATLGEVRQTFRPKIAEILAGVILGVAFIIGGIAVAIYVITVPDPNPEPGEWIPRYILGFGLFGCGLPICGIGLLWWMKKLASHRVTIHDRGFSFSYGRSTELCSWLEVEKIIEVFTKEKMKLLNLPGAAIRNVDRTFVVHRTDNKEFEFTNSSIGNNIPQLGDYFEEARDRHKIKWARIKR